MCQQAIDEAEATESVAPIISSPDQFQDDSPLNLPTPAGQTIGRYKDCTPHVDGLHSTIFQSRREDNTLVALKVTVPHLLGAPHDSKREVQLLQEAASPHVIPLVEVFNLAGGRLILVFPFMRSNLEDLLRDMFGALAYIHRLGIIHRDVKPSNILLDSPDGPAYLADFGIAWKEGSEGSELPGEKILDVGTTCYRPPEILFGLKEYGIALDLWAAGCVVAEAVSVDHKQLFDSGPVGSDLSLIQSIFTTLGTPDEVIWPVGSNQARSSPPGD